MVLPVNGVGLRETCFFCGSYLLNRCYAVEIRGDMRLVCSHCFRLYHDGADDLLRLRSADTFTCDGCGRTMVESAYSPTIFGSYCIDCVSRAVETLHELREAAAWNLRRADSSEGGE